MTYDNQFYPKLNSDTVVPPLFIQFMQLAIVSSDHGWGLLSLLTVVIEYYSR